MSLRSFFRKRFVKLWVRVLFWFVIMLVILSFFKLFAQVIHWWKV